MCQPRTTPTSRTSQSGFQNLLDTEARSLADHFSYPQLAELRSSHASSRRLAGALGTTSSARSTTEERQNAVEGTTSREDSRLLLQENRESANSFKRTSSTAAAAKELDHSATSVSKTSSGEAERERRDVPVPTVLDHPLMKTAPHEMDFPVSDVEAAPAVAGAIERLARRDEMNRAFPRAFLDEWQNSGAGVPGDVTGDWAPREIVWGGGGTRSAVPSSSGAVWPGRTIVGGAGGGTTNYWGGSAVRQEPTSGTDGRMIPMTPPLHGEGGSWGSSSSTGDSTGASSSDGAASATSDGEHPHEDRGGGTTAQFYVDSGGSSAAVDVELRRGTTWSPTATTHGSLQLHSGGPRPSSPLAAPQEHQTSTARSAGRKTAPETTSPSGPKGAPPAGPRDGSLRPRGPPTTSSLYSTTTSAVSGLLSTPRGAILPTLLAQPDPTPKPIPKHSKREAKTPEDVAKDAGMDPMDTEMQEKSDGSMGWKLFR